MKVEKDKLRKIIQEEINKFPSHYRCHEGARIIGRKLKKLGYNISVKDGGVIFKNIFDLLFYEELENFLEEEKEEFFRDSAPKKELRVIHSWCEITESSKNIIIVDWHAHLDFSSGFGVNQLLIVDDKENLPHKYIPMGVGIFNCIIFPIFPPRLVKLNI